MFVSASFGTFWCALLLTLHSVAADAKPPLTPSVAHQDAKKIKTLKVEPILTDLNTGRRSVLLLSSYLTRFLFIVSAPGQKDLTGAVVFDQPLDTFNGTSVTLNPPVLFTDKWPKVTGGTSGLLFTVPDSSGSSYLVIANSKKIQLLHLKTGDFTDGKWSTTVCSIVFSNASPVSSSEMMTSFSFFNDNTIIKVMKYTFKGSSVATSSSVQPVGLLNHLPICRSAGTQIFLSVTECSQSITLSEWNITTGFVASSSVYLVDGVHLSILKFDQNWLKGANNKSSYTTIGYSSFFRKAVIPTTTTPPPPTTHHIKTSHLILYCSIGGGLLLLLIVIAFCLCFCVSKPKTPSTATSSSGKAATAGSAPKLSPQPDPYSPYIVPSDAEKEDIANFRFLLPPSVSENDKKVAKSAPPYVSFVGPVFVPPSSYVKAQAKAKGKGKGKVDSLMENLYKGAKMKCAELPTKEALEYQESLPCFKKRQTLDLLPKKKVSKGRARSSSRKLNAPARKRSSGKVAPSSGKTSSASGCPFSKVSLAKKRSTGKGVSGKRASGKTSPKAKK